MKHIKNILASALIISFVSTANAQFWGNKKVSGNGNMTTVTRTTSEYNEISCAGFMDFVLVSGEEGNIKIEGEENLLDFIMTESDGERLIVKVENGVNLNPSWNKGIKITIPFKSLDKISLAGSGDVWNDDTMNSSNFYVSLAGSGDINLKVDTDKIKSSISGSGDITLTGKTNKLETSVTGSGDFHGFGLDANNTEAYVTGSGDVRVVSNHMLTAKVTGSGDIEYKGSPEKEDTKVVGSGSISK